MGTQGDINNFLDETTVGRILDPGGFLSTSKNKVYTPTGWGIERGAFANPSQDYRGALLSQAFGPGNLAPQVGAAAMDTAGYEKAGLGYGTAKAGYERGLASSEEDRRRALQARGQQQAALGLSQIAAQGGAPSAAAIQQKQGLDAAIASQMAMANSARGGASAGVMAQRQAAFNTAELQQKAINDAALLRAQEMAQARGEYAAGTGAIRAADTTALGLGLQQAGLGTQFGGLTAQQQALALQAAGTQAGYQQQANLANQQAFLSQDQINTARQLGLLGQLGGIDTRTMEGAMGYQGLNVQQNTALQKMIADQNAAIAQMNQQKRAGGAGLLAGVLGGIFG